MTRVHTLFTPLTLLVLSSSALAADPARIAGVWTTQTEVQGISINETCTVQQAADGTLTGRCETSSGTFPLTGKVDGKKVTFSHRAAYQEEDMTVSFTGTLDDETTVSGSVDLQPLNAGGAFAMKKQPAK